MKTSGVKALQVVPICAIALLNSGCTNVLGFGTATKFGLDISQRADQTVDVSLGYDRAEIASIPAPKKADAKLDSEGHAESDTYSVLGTFRVKYGNPFRDAPLVLHQLFATGSAARAAARDPSMQAFFGGQAHEIAEQKAGQGQESKSSEGEK